MLTDDPELSLQLKEYYERSLDGFNFMCFGSEQPIEILNKQAASFIRLECELLEETQTYYVIFNCTEDQDNRYYLKYSSGIENVYPEFAEAQAQKIFGYSDKQMECINAYLTNYCNYMWFYD